MYTQVSHPVSEIVANYRVWLSDMHPLIFIHRIIYLIYYMALVVSYVNLCDENTHVSSVYRDKGNI